VNFLKAHYCHLKYLFSLSYSSSIFCFHGLGQNILEIHHKQIRLHEDNERNLGGSPHWCGFATYSNPVQKRYTSFHTKLLKTSWGQKRMNLSESPHEGGSATYSTLSPMTQKCLPVVCGLKWVPRRLWFQRCRSSNKHDSPSYDVYHAHLLPPSALTFGNTGRNFCTTPRPTSHINQNDTQCYPCITFN